MLAGTLAGIVASSLLSATPSATPAPTLAELDQKRFELHLGGHGTGRFVSGPAAGGGGLQFGLGVRLWRGLYLEAALGEALYSSPAGSAAGSDDALAFRHLGHAEPAPAPAPDATNTGDAAASPGAASMLIVGQILLGVRYEVRTPATMHLRPTVFLGASHLHEASFADFLAKPGATLAGIAPSIRHRTGLQAGLGLRAPFPERWGPVAPRFSARLGVDVAYYFDDAPGRLQAGANVGVQVVF